MKNQYIKVEKDQANRGMYLITILPLSHSFSSEFEPMITVKKRFADFQLEDFIEELQKVMEE